SDLVEVAHREDSACRTVEFVELSKQHRADRNVYPDAQRVRSANDLQIAPLCQPLHQPSVLREHAGVVDADAVRDEALKLLAEWAVEAKPVQLLAKCLLLLFAREVEAG